MSSGTPKQEQQQKPAAAVTPPAASPAGGFKGIPKLNLGGVPSGGGWALGEQVQMMPSMEDQKKQGLQIYKKDNDKKPKNAAASGDGKNAAEAAKDGKNTFFSSSSLDANAAAAAAADDTNNSTTQNKNNSSGTINNTSVNSDTVAASSATQRPPGATPPVPPAAVQLRTKQQPNLPPVVVPQQKPAAGTPGGASSSGSHSSTNYPVDMAARIGGGSPPQVHALQQSSGSGGGRPAGISVPGGAGGSSAAGGGGGGSDSCGASASATNLNSPSMVPMKQPGDSLNVHALVSDADVPALLAQQQAASSSGENGDGQSLGGRMLSKVVRAVACDHNNKLLWVAAATETAIVGYSLLGSSLEVRHRVGTDGFFATALCITVAASNNSSGGGGAPTSGYTSPPATTTKGGGSGGGGNTPTQNRSALDESGTSLEGSSSAGGANAITRQRAMIDAGSDLLWVGMQDGSLVPISLFFFSERNERIKFPSSAMSNNNNNNNGNSSSDGGNNSDGFPPSAPPVESLVAGPSGNHLWALHRRSIRDGGGVVALLWDTVVVGRLVASLELISSPGRCIVSPSKNGAFIWSATHVGDNDACTVRCWQQDACFSSPGALLELASAANGDDAAEATARKLAPTPQPALFLNTFGSVSCLESFSMGSATATCNSDSSVWGATGEHALLGGEGGLLVLSYNEDGAPTALAPNGFDAMQVSAFSVVPHSFSDSPIQQQQQSLSQQGSPASPSGGGGACSQQQHYLVVAAGLFAPHEPERGAAVPGGRASTESPTLPEAAFGEFPRVAILRLSLEEESFVDPTSDEEEETTEQENDGRQQQQQQQQQQIQKRFKPTLTLIRVGFEYYFQPSIVSLIPRPRTYQGGDALKLLGVVVHSEFQDEVGGAEGWDSVMATSVTLVALQPTVDEGEWGIPGFIMRAAGGAPTSAALGTSGALTASGYYTHGGGGGAHRNSQAGIAGSGGGGSGTGSGNANQRSAAGTMREDGSMLPNFSFSDPRMLHSQQPAMQQQQQSQMQGSFVGSPGSPTPTNKQQQHPPGSMQYQQGTPVSDRERSQGPPLAVRPVYGNRVIGAGGSFVALGPTPTNADGDSQPRRISRSPASTPSGAVRGNYPPMPPQHYQQRMTPRSAAAAAVAAAAAAAEQKQHQQYQHHHHHVAAAAAAAGAGAGGRPSSEPRAPSYSHHPHFYAADHHHDDPHAAAATAHSVAMHQQQLQSQALEDKLDRIMRRITPDESILAVSEDLARLYRSVSGACSTVAAAPPTGRARLAALEAPECVEQLSALACSSEAEFAGFQTHEIKSLRHLLRTLSAVALGKMGGASVTVKRSTACQTSEDVGIFHDGGNGGTRRQGDVLAALLEKHNERQRNQNFFFGGGGGSPSATAAAASSAFQSTVAALESQLKDAVSRYEVMAKSWKTLENFVNAATPSVSAAGGGGDSGSSEKKIKQHRQQQHLFAKLEPVDWLCPTSQLPARMSERLGILTSMWVPPEDSLFHQQQQLQQLQAQLQRLRQEASVMHAAAARSDQLLTAAGSGDPNAVAAAAALAELSGSLGRRRGHSKIHHVRVGSSGGTSGAGATTSSLDSSFEAQQPQQQQQQQQNSKPLAESEGAASKGATNGAQTGAAAQNQQLKQSSSSSSGERATVESPLSQLTEQLSNKFMDSFKKRQLPSSVSQKLHVAVADICTSLGAAIRLGERCDILSMAASVGNSSASAVSVVMSLRSHLINSLAIPHRGLGKLNEGSHKNFFRAEISLLFRSTAAASPKRGGGSASPNAAAAAGTNKTDQESIVAYLETAVQRPPASTDARQTTLSMRSAGLKWLLIHLYATMRIFSALCNQSVANSFGGMHHEERDLLVAQLRSGEFEHRYSTLQEFFSTLAASAVDTSNDLSRRVIDFIGRALSVASDITAAAQASAAASSSSGASSPERSSSPNSHHSASTAVLMNTGSVNVEILSLLSQIRETIKQEAAAAAAAAASSATASNASSAGDVIG